MAGFSSKSGGPAWGLAQKKLLFGNLPKARRFPERRATRGFSLFTLSQIVWKSLSEVFQSVFAPLFQASRGSAPLPAFNRRFHRAPACSREKRRALSGSIPTGGASEVLVGKDQKAHGLGYRSEPRGQAGVVAAFDFDCRGISMEIDSLLLDGDRRGGLDEEAGGYRKPGGKASQDASMPVREGPGGPQGIV